MLDIAFGDVSHREHALAAIRVIHTRVRGTLSQATGSFPAGTPYSAEDPALLLWVHLTLIESTVLTFERLVHGLSEGDRDEYCRVSAPVPVALGAAAADVPRSWSHLRHLVAARLDSGDIVVSTQAREIGRALLAGPVMRIVPPAAWLNRLITAGMLPPTLRSAYGLSWSDRSERTLDRVSRAIRTGRRHTPSFIARFTDARREPQH